MLFFQFIEGTTLLIFTVEFQLEILSFNLSWFIYNEFMNLFIFFRKKKEKWKIKIKKETEKRNAVYERK